MVISPLVEACPTKKKASSMGLLHSFYCWGSVFVILVSTLLFNLVGISQWRAIACVWAILPAANAVLFCFVPLYSLPKSETEEAPSFRSLAKNRKFWVLFVLMFCAGATEVAVAQWASAFAEDGLGVSKTLGDLAGPMAFAVLMGICRIFYAKSLNKISLEKFLVIGAVGCIGAYLLIALPPLPVLNLIGCAVCGLFVGILWPGTFSSAAKSVALRGNDVVCTAGPRGRSGLYGRPHACRLRFRHVRRQLAGRAPYGDCLSHSRIVDCASVAEKKKSLGNDRPRSTKITVTLDRLFFILPLLFLAID